jgi:hypothetical protein
MCSWWNDCREIEDVMVHLGYRNGCVLDRRLEGGMRRTDAIICTYIQEFEVTYIHQCIELQ